MIPATRQRWLQVGMGALVLVGALVALWFAWELNFVHERQAMIETLRTRGAIVTTFDDQSAPLADSDSPYARVRIPFWRRYLGDETVPFIGLVPGAQSAEAEHDLRALFPEAKLQFVSLNWNGSHLPRRNPQSDLPTAAEK
jgi:hypothetical protein